MKKQCLKCGLVNENATGDELEACPGCGAIYSRVAAAAAAARGVLPTPQGAGPAASPRRPVQVGAYVTQLRENSIYPTFRQVVNIFAIVGYVLAALVALGALFSLVKVNIGAGLLGLAFAIFLVVVTRMSKEMSLMVADASDALVRMAARQEQG